MDSALQDVP